MTLEKDDEFNKDDIIDRLKSKGQDGYRMITYVDFLFSPAVFMLFTILNMKFMFKRGHPAYNRMKLYGIFYVCTRSKCVYFDWCFLFV